MKVRRKYNLSRIGIRYESVDIEVNADTIEEATLKLDEAWVKYSSSVLKEENPSPDLHPKNEAEKERKQVGL